MKESNLLLKVLEFFPLLLLAEGFYFILSSELNISSYFYIPIISLFIKVVYDFYRMVFYKFKINYLEEYIKEIVSIVFISILAGGIAYIADIMLKGNVRITLLSVIAVLYLSTNNK